MFSEEEEREATRIAALRPPAFEPGFFSTMPAVNYHAIEAMSSSGAKKILRSPEHYLLARTTQNAPTAAMQFGTVVHAAVLEPDTLLTIACAAPEWKFHGNSNDGKAERAEFAAAATGRIVLPAADFRRALRCADAVRRNRAAAKILAGANVEESLFWIDGKYKVPCKVRWDIRNLGGLADLKTCQDASAEKFAKDCATFLYHVQNAHYFAGAEAVLNETPRFFVFIAVESEEPHAVKCYTLPPEAVRYASGRLDLALERYAKARESGQWIGYGDTIDVLPFPRYALKFNE
jgi:exodeoxyribonuclease VIII